jgi:hypothetical protein
LNLDDISPSPQTHKSPDNQANYCQDIVSQQHAVRSSKSSNLNSRQLMHNNVISPLSSIQMMKHHPH